SIAQAVVENLHDSPQLGCRTLFASHYHELTSLADELARVRNARVEVEEEGERVTFLHRIVPGGADRSFGIHVARLAGIPASVVLRARDLLAELERQRPLGAAADGSQQLSLDIAAPAHTAVANDLAELDLDAMSPLEALNKLAELKTRASP
ncbi:MAG: DNA mismatch repair protein MutS, partial [Candidatus Dormibacteraeota bacterium]|nr:DNA mismatch repair protein MutS [Candidatus Dormibacteraeota bacterium]